MMPQEFLPRGVVAAEEAQHPWPEFAACEAALESGWDTSILSLRDSNLFGMKQHLHALYGTANLPTREWTNGAWVATTAHWVIYPDWRACFQDRVNTLRRLSAFYPHYAAALAAQDGVTYVTEVSKTWSTDPNRAAKVIEIHQAHFPLGVQQ